MRRKPLALSAYNSFAVIGNGGDSFLDWYAQFLTSLVQPFAMFRRYQFVPLGLQDVHARWLFPLGSRFIDNKVQIGPTVEVIAKKWPEIFVRKPFLGVQGFQHGFDVEKWRFEYQASNWESSRELARCSKVGSNSGPDTLAPA